MAITTFIWSLIHSLTQPFTTWMSNYLPEKINDVITYPCTNFNWSILAKGALEESIRDIQTWAASVVSWSLLEGISLSRFSGVFCFSWIRYHSDVLRSIWCPFHTIPFPHCWNTKNLSNNNGQTSQISECTRSISHNAPLKTEMCTFLVWMEHCGIWNRCILGFVNKVISTKYLGIPLFHRRSHDYLSGDDFCWDLFPGHHIVTLSVMACTYLFNGNLLTIWFTAKYFHQISITEEPELNGRKLSW